MKVMDPEYGQSIPIFAEGQYGLKVMDAERFLIQLVGTLESFTAADLRKHFMGSLVSKTKSTISSFVAANGVGINYISAHLDELSQFIHQPLSEFWEGYGFALTGFYITTVDIDTSTELGKKIEKAVASRSAQGIAGYTWQQAQMASVAKTAATNGGSMGGMMAAAMLAGNNGAAAGMVGTIMQPNYGTMQTQMQQSMNGQTMAGQQTYSQPGYPQWGMNAGGPKVKEVFCARCGKKHPVDQRFCPSCGKEYIACPVCGADNPEKSQRCIKCGTHLAQDNYEDGTVCPRCGKPYKPGVNRFCPSCGNKLG